MGLLETVKKAAEAERNASAPCGFMFGTVTKTSPLTIRVDNRFDISGDAIVAMKEFRAGFYATHSHVLKDDYQQTSTDETSEYYYGLTVGDKVVLLRNQGGQSYLVLGRV